MAIHATTLTQRVAHSLFSWEWTKKLLYWIVMSAGTMSECAFLIASIYMSLNASVHPLVLLLVSEQTSTHIAELATAAYVALPECILALAIVTVISHARMWLYNREKAALIWTVLYGIPTVIFLVLSLVTLGCAVASADFRLPEGFVIVRALAGYAFALTSLLHMQLGVPQERERLTQKDVLLAQVQENHAQMIERIGQENARMIAQIHAENEREIEALSQKNQNLLAQIEKQSDEAYELKQLLQSERNTQLELLKAVNKSREEALEAYSEECAQWLGSGVKTVSIDDIARYTGHSKQKVIGAIKRGNLQTSSRNKELVMVSSLVEWLKANPPLSTDNERDTTPLLHVINGD